MKKAFIIVMVILFTFGAFLFSHNDLAAKDATEIGQCMGDCAAEQGICIGQCMGDGQCISRCNSAYSRCVSRCN